MASNGKDARTGTLAEPDAHGQASLTTSQAVDIIKSAAEVKVEVATAAGESKGRMEASLSLLAKMATSFEVDRV
jgi:hypothetical protein